jgi:rubrerythrin
VFSVMDLCHIAIQIERNGEAVYRKASLATEDEQARALLIQLADDELRHVNWFESFNLSHAEPPVHSQLESAGKELLQSMMENQSFSLASDSLSKGTRLAGILAQSLEFEKDTILFYEMLSNFIEEEEVGQKLNMIIAEERTHVDKLQAILITEHLASG